ncbi:helix-turn-helix transcriptional regulator [Aureimonas altamirensis]|uniref:helix-turn-helix transcriptional regulator n=1 Tax=Aureimonas altamirensis TaxID=370622 RepID=UPI002556709C|nr:helix-turn-helix transcriptional regulator [Aureimonas altamirensis]
MHITAAQCRAARALVELDQAELAKRSNLSRNTIVDFEKGRRLPGTNNLSAIQSALEAAGVVFLDTGKVATGPGVALRGD